MRLAVESEMDRRLAYMIWCTQCSWCSLPASKILCQLVVCLYSWVGEHVDMNALCTCVTALACTYLY